MNDIYETVKPYTYLVKCIPTGQVYYGVRWRNKHVPANDLWRYYFTSSKKIKALRRLYGDDAFVFQIRKTFQTPEQAVGWERKVLLRMNVLKKSEWLNGNISGVKFRRSGPMSAATRLKMSIAKKNRVITAEEKRNMSLVKLGSIPHNKGKKGIFQHTAESKKRIGEKGMGRKLSNNHIQILKARKGTPSKLKGRKGRPLSEDAKANLRIKRSALKWFNNGEKNILSEMLPGPEWVNGRLTKNLRWFNDGLRNKMFEISPSPDWSIGKIKKV